jgi:hypothetical protein
MKSGFLSVIAAAILAVSGNAWAKPITYTGFWTTDVGIGGITYFGARVYISFDADTRAVKPFPDGTRGFLNDVGTAHIKVISGNTVITARLAPNQIYVYFDITNASVGFGSYAGGRGYPLSLTANETNLTSNSLIGAVSDILINNDSASYSSATGDLANDLGTAPLRHSTTLSGPASSCVAFDPTTSICSNLTPIPLGTTNLGSLYLFEPYTLDACGTGFDLFEFPSKLVAGCGVAPNRALFSVNWGIFWAEVEE